MHQAFDGANVPLLHTCIDKYTKNEYEQFAKDTKGLKDDLAAVENALLNRHISNGPIEETNTKIKLLIRIRYGKAEIELLNAVAILSSTPECTYAAYAT